MQGYKNKSNRIVIKNIIICEKNIDDMELGEWVMGDAADKFEAINEFADLL